MKPIPHHNELISGFQTGQESAVREVYSMYYRPLCYFAEKLVMQRQVAEDIVVDAFLKLLQKKQEFGQLSGIRSFLYTIVRNACMDWIRRDKVHAKATSELQYLSVAAEHSVDQELITARVLQIIYNEIEKLPPQNKRIFKSIFMDGKTSAAVAEEMGLSVQTVLNQKTKALNILRLALDRENLYSSVILFSCLLLMAAQNKA